MRSSVDVLVSNAGICPFSEFLTMPPETWERTRQVNLDGAFYITQGKQEEWYIVTKCSLRTNVNSGGEPNEESNTPGRFHHRHFLHLCPRGRRVPGVGCMGMDSLRNSH